MRDLYRDFLTDARESLAVLRTACAQHEPDTFREKAHYLKSSTSVLGMRSLAQVCAAMDEMGKTENLLRASEEVDEAERLLDEIERELARRLGPDVVPKSNAAA